MRDLVLVKSDCIGIVLRPGGVLGDKHSGSGFDHFGDGGGLGRRVMVSSCRLGLRRFHQPEHANQRKRRRHVRRIVPTIGARRHFTPAVPFTLQSFKRLKWWEGGTRISALIYWLYVNFYNQFETIPPILPPKENNTNRGRMPSSLVLQNDQDITFETSVPSNAYLGSGPIDLGVVA